jgi:hypothetical protein
MTHSFAGFSPWSLCPVVLGLWQGNHHDGGCVMEQTETIMVKREQKTCVPQFPVKLSTS